MERAQELHEDFSKCSPPPHGLREAVTQMAGLNESIKRLSKLDRVYEEDIHGNPI